MKTKTLLLLLFFISNLSFAQTVKPIVVIKADDLKDPLNPNWQTFFNLIRDSNICASAGIEYEFLQTNQNAKNVIVGLNNEKYSNGKKLFEFWCHGYDHSRMTNAEANMATSKPVPGDYDGDKIIDYALITNNNKFFIHFSKNKYTLWDEVYSNYDDLNGIPISADFDGDGRADLSVKFNNGFWKIDYSNNGFGQFDTAIYYGWNNSNSQGLVGYFDPSTKENPNRKADISLKTINGTWKIDYSKNGYGSWDEVYYYGYDDINREKPVPADYDGDSLTDLAVRCNDGTWKIDYASNGLGTWYARNGTGIWDVVINGYGNSSSSEALAEDFDGDGKADISVKSQDGSWLIDYALNGFGVFDTGQYSPEFDQNFYPFPADYDGDGKADLSGVNYIKGWWYSISSLTNQITYPISYKIEFANTGMDFQKNHFDSCNTFFTKTLGLSSYAFGAPYNQFDSETIEILNENNYPIKIWMDIFPDTDSIKNWNIITNPSKRKVLNHKLFFQVKVSDSGEFSEDSLNSFIAQYNNGDFNKLKYLVIQIHPSNWANETSFQNFESLIHFIKSNGMEFKTPSEIYEDLNSTYNSLSKNIGIDNESLIVSSIDKFNENYIKIYPNPAINMINILIKSKSNKNFYCEIFNNVGIKILQAEMVSNTLHQVSLDRLLKGSYYINFKSDNEYFTQKLIIIK